MVVLAGCCSLQTGAPTTPSSPARDTYTFHVDKALTPFAIALIRRACDKWENYSNGIVRFEILHDLEEADLGTSIAQVPTIVAVSSTTPAVVAFEKESRCSTCMTLGLTTRVESPHHPVIFLVVDRLEDPHDFYEVVLHEIGHAIGLDHVTDENSVMYARHQIPAPACPSKSDMIEFCSRRYCNLEDVKWCD